MIDRIEDLVDDGAGSSRSDWYLVVGGRAVEY